MTAMTLQPHYRTVWISDVHLGTRGCQADLLLDFLNEVTADTYYLVGDIIDGWRLKKSWYWPESHHAVITTIMEKAKNGAKVIFVPG
ncbi:MAG TPA: UDP-2,3-diacylglucosamine hydrolase, partial [Thalassospira sp.]|nr:UDP-2,3-diacylglucosamine hydrolase [Thalassospira sp.]